MLRLTLVVVPLLALASCKTENTAFCAMHPGLEGCPGDATNGGTCKGSSDCNDTPEFPLCDTTDNTCVQCTAGDHTHCMGMTPRCEDRACVACVDDSDCDAGAGVCLPTGGCADPSGIIHAVLTMNGSTAPDCGAVDKACTLDTALSLPKSSTKNVIKLDDAGPYISAMNNFVVNTDAAIELTIDARGTVLHHNSDGAILTINSDKASNKAVTILGGTFEGATGGGGDAIRCNANATLSIYGTIIRGNEESAIDAATCTVTVTGADIRGNSTKSGTALYPGILIADGSITISQSSIASNRGGGLVVNNNGKFEVVGNVFLSNGDSGANVSGVSVNTTASGNRLEFNTITQNTSGGTMGAGVQCSAAGFTAQNNIIWNNNSAIGINGIQVTGCSYTYSDIGPTFVPTVNDHNNVSLNPLFINELTDFHLQPGTMVRGKANPDADLTGIASKDMDGKVRIRPADLGAYVAPPQ